MCVRQRGVEPPHLPHTAGSLTGTPVSKLRREEAVCPQRQDDTNQDSLGEAAGQEKHCFLFLFHFFFFLFCLKGVALPGLETSTSLQWGAPGPAAQRNSTGKVPATVVGSGFLGRGGGTKVSRPWCHLGQGWQLWVPELQSRMPRPTCHSLSSRF